MGRRIPLLFLVVALVGAGIVVADWRGEGRLRGRVLDAEGRPAAGATVRAHLADEPASGPPPATTDAEGRWTLNGLAGGGWELTIDQPGQIVSRGRAVVVEGVSPEMIEVRLRSLDEVSPRATEGNPNAVMEWIDKGNSFLRDGRTVEARAEYELALAALPWTSRAELLQGIARTHYLEGERERALQALQDALRIEPGNETLRRLLLGVYESLDRAGEAEGFLAGLADRPTEPPPRRPAEDAGQADEPPPWSLRPVLEPAPHRTGRFRLRLTERSPLGSVEEYARRHGVEPKAIRAEDPGAASYGIAGETFEVFVPETYRPDVPHALFVWVSPTAFGGTERAELQRLLAERRVIWIGADASGNERARWDRAALALDAATAMVRLYAIDPQRIWVGGYSGGGRVASGLTLLYPEVFHGGLFVMGCDFYRDLPVPDHPGASWPAAFREPPSSVLRGQKQEQRFVILTGSRDFNVSRCRAVHEAYARERFRRVLFLEVPGMSHYDPVPVEWWDRAWRFLGGEAGPS